MKEDRVRLATGLYDWQQLMHAAHILSLQAVSSVQCGVWWGLLWAQALP